MVIDESKATENSHFIDASAMARTFKTLYLWVTL